MSMEFSKDLHRAKAHYDELYSAYRTVAHVLNNIPEDDRYWDYLRQVKVRLGNAAEEFRQRYLERLADEVNA